MSTPDLGAVLHVPGRLCFNPTNLSTAWPHGGTGLGEKKQLVVKPMRSYSTIKEEAFGQEVIDVLDMGESWMLACIFRSLDGDMLGKAFPSTFTGTSSGLKGISYPGSFRAGTLKSDSAFKLLFTPDDEDRHPWVYFPNTLMLVDESAELALDIPEELGVSAVFHATRDSTARVVIIGRKGDITL